MQVDRKQYMTAAKLGVSAPLGRGVMFDGEG